MLHGDFAKMRELSDSPQFSPAKRVCHGEPVFPAYNEIASQYLTSRRTPPAAFSRVFKLKTTPSPLTER